VKQVLRVTQADNLYEDNVCLCPLTSKCAFSQIKSIVQGCIVKHYASNTGAISKFTISELGFFNVVIVIIMH